MGKPRMTIAQAAERFLMNFNPDALELVGGSARNDYDELRAALNRAAASSPDPGYQRWVIAFDVAECWVEDGFDPDDSGALDMLANRLGMAHVGNDQRAKVVQAPDREVVAKLMGYKSAADRASRGGR